MQATSRSWVADLTLVYKPFIDGGMTRETLLGFKLVFSRRGDFDDGEPTSCSAQH